MNTFWIRNHSTGRTRRIPRRPVLPLCSHICHLTLAPAAADGVSAPSSFVVLHVSCKQTQAACTRFRRALSLQISAFESHPRSAYHQPFSFSQLSSIPLCGHTTVTYPSPTEGPVGCLQVLTVMKKPLSIEAQVFRVSRA